MLLLTLTVSLLSLIDLSAIIGGYFENILYYWYADKNGVLLLFREEEMDIYEASFISARNWIITLVYFSAVWMVCTALTSRYFGKRRYGASQWPLTLWKMSTCLITLRLFATFIVLYKFHYELIEFENFEALISLYANGTVGLIPAVLFGSIFINVLVLIGAIRSIMKTAEWYRLNVAKRL